MSIQGPQFNTLDCDIFNALGRAVLKAVPDPNRTKLGFSGFPPHTGLDWSCICQYLVEKEFSFFLLISRIYFPNIGISFCMRRQCMFKIIPGVGKPNFNDSKEV